MGTREDLVTIVDWVSSGRISPVVDSLYKLNQMEEARKRLHSRQVFGKIVVET